MHATATAETVIEGYCRKAGLAPVSTEALLLHLCDGMTAREIRRKLKFKRVAEVQALLESGLKRIGKLPGWREVLRQTVRPQQFERFINRDDRELTTEEAMRGPRPPAPPTPMIGDTWTEVCNLPGRPRREAVPVLMSQTVYRWW